MKSLNKKLASLSRRLDPCWRLVAFALRLRRLGATTAPPQSILVVDLHLIGDIVMLIPLLRVIRRHHPDAHLGLIAGPWSGAILGGTGLVDEFIPLRAPWVAKGRRATGLGAVIRAIRKSRARVWDWGIDVRGDVRNILLLALARAKRRVAYDFSGGAALLTDVIPDGGMLRHIIDHHATIAEYLHMPMSEEDRIPVLRVGGRTASKAGAFRQIGFHFGASMCLRRMPLEEACALLLRFQNREGTRLILVDAPDTRTLNAAVLERLPASFSDRIERWEGDLGEFADILNTLDEFYAMDSGPAHLAAALGIDTTVFFGPQLSLVIRPIGRKVTIIERMDVRCRPCDQLRCTNPHYQECLTQIVRHLDGRLIAGSPASPQSSQC